MHSMTLMIGRIATAGRLLVLVPDLYRGDTTQEAREAGHHMGDIGRISLQKIAVYGLKLRHCVCADWIDAAKDVDVAGKYMKEKLGCPRVGMAGYCVGGVLVIMAAAQRQEAYSAAVCYYGYIPGNTRCHFSFSVLWLLALHLHAMPCDAATICPNLFPAGRV